MRLYQPVGKWNGKTMAQTIEPNEILQFNHTNRSNSEEVF